MCYKTALFIILFSVFAFAQANTVVIAYEDRSNPPHYFAGNTTPAQHPGITPELLNLIAKRLSIKITYQRFPWSRCLSMLERNLVDAIFHASFKQERMKLGVYPMKAGQPDSLRRVHRKAYSLYKLKGNELAWDGKQFKHLNGKVGATFKYAIVGQLREMGVEVEEAYDLPTNLRKLIGGRLVGVVDLENMVDFALEKHNTQFANVVKVTPPISVKDYYLIFSHQFFNERKQLANAIWEEIYQSHQSGEYTKISKKYLNK